MGKQIGKKVIAFVCASTMLATFGANGNNVREIIAAENQEDFDGETATFPWASEFVTTATETTETSVETSTETTAEAPAETTVEAPVETTVETSTEITTEEKTEHESTSIDIATETTPTTLQTTTAQNTTAPSTIVLVLSTPSGDATTNADVEAPAKAKVAKINSKKLSAKKLTLVIKKQKMAKGYQVQISKAKKFTKKNILVNKNVKSVKLTIKSKKLGNKKKMFVRVRAYKLDGVSKIYGKWSKTTIVKSK